MNFKQLLEQERQKLNEAFDLPFNWDWSGPREAVFQVGDYDYLVYFKYVDNLAQVISEFRNYNMSLDGWEVSFGVLDDSEENGFSDSVETKDYKAIRILSTVVDIINSFVERTNLNFLVFEIDTESELNRLNVYKKMLDRYLPFNFRIIHLKDKFLWLDTLVIYNDLYQEDIESVLGVA